jgi:paraquat-inducible protein B
MDNLSKGGKELSTNLTQFSSETDRENFNVLKMRSELVHLITNEISLSLENFRKEMFLNYLIKATCPLAEDESLISRQKELNSVLKQMTSAWQSKVKNSMDRLEVIKKECETISRKKEEFLSQFRAKKTSEAELNRVDEYEKIFQSILKLSKENYMRVTSKYLILRHNGKVAQEVSNQRKAEALERHEAAKEELSNCEKEVLVKVFPYIILIFSQQI